MIIRLGGPEPRTLVVPVPAVGQVTIDTIVYSRR